MALSITSWANSVQYRTIYESNLTNSVNTYVTGSPGVVTMIIFDNSEGSAANYLKVHDGYTATSGQTEPTIRLRASAGEKLVVNMPTGIFFEKGVCFWGTASASTADNTTPAVNANGTAKVTIVASSRGKGDY